MATVVVQQPHTSIGHSQTPPPHTSSLSLNAPRSSTPIPNKHLPYCPPGPSPQAANRPVTPPSSPPLKQLAPRPTPALYPPTSVTKLSTSPPVYSLDPSTLVTAIEQVATQPLPDPQQVFPWLHGLHVENHVQLAFFTARKRAFRRTPRCLRGITIIKAGGDLSHSKIKGAIAPEEVLNLTDDDRCDFLDCDPKEGFSVRNFQIQAAKFAKISDIVIYGDRCVSPRAVRALAERVAKVQLKWKKDIDGTGEPVQTFNTFVLSVPFHELENRYPDLVAVDSEGVLMDVAFDFCQSERAEMCAMSKASAVSGTVYQGPSPDFNMLPAEPTDGNFDIYIEASDQSQLPEQAYLDGKTAELDLTPIHLDFPSSGSVMPPSWSQTEVDGIMRMCQWIYRVTHDALPQARSDSDGDIPMTDLPRRHRKVLIHCADGYTETSLLTIAYYMYAEGVPAHEAWVQLHCDRHRNFFAYPSDVALLTSIQSRILAESPKSAAKVARRVGGGRRPVTKIEDPAWLSKMDGSLPSRILPYMYLGNLTHANNPELLRAIGIKRILSIGEMVTWTPEEAKHWDEGDLMYIDRVQDNGIDPLTQEFGKCLNFIGRGTKPGATLVHCRVGVSRSATICIAEVMASHGLSFPRAYCFVRARRLNVIIQPHLRFVYELMKWDEKLQIERSVATPRSPLASSNGLGLLNEPIARVGTPMCRKRSRSEANHGDEKMAIEEIEEQEQKEKEKDNSTPLPIRSRMVALQMASNGIKRELDWPTICREIAGLNKPYARQ